VLRLSRRIRRLALAGCAAFTLSTADAMNGCLVADFVDRRGLAQIQVANDDPTNPFRYRPRCVTVSEGTHVVFRATPNFGMHPLYGGTVSGGVATIDPDSPIGSNGIGNEVDRLLSDTGEFPFFCDVHYAQGMAGSVRVVPELFKDGFDAAQGQ
jgi:plastocyanin